MEVATLSTIVQTAQPQGTNPIILILVGLIALIVLGYLFFRNKFGKEFEKDYDKEGFNHLVYNAETTAITPSPMRFWLILSALFAGIIFSVFSVFILWIIDSVTKWGLLNIFPIWFFALAIIFFGLVGVLLVIRFDNLISKYPKLYNAHHRVMGYILAEPFKSQDGFINILFYNSFDWGVLKRKKVIRIPTNKTYTYNILNKTSEKKSKPIEQQITFLKSLKGKGINEAMEKTKAHFKKPIQKSIQKTFENELFGIGLFKRYQDNDIIIFCKDFEKSYKVDFYYPVMLTPKGIEDFREAIFNIEKRSNEIYNMYDVLNENRENAVIAVGGNVSIQQEQQKGEGV